MKHNIWLPLSLLFLFFVFSPLAVADNGQTAKPFEIRSDCTYESAPGDSEAVSEALCLFGAKYKAVALAAKYFNHAGLLKDYGKMEKEIFCLAADSLDVDVIEEKKRPAGRQQIRIKTRIGLADFTRAEIENRDLESQENRFSWQQEMEQYLYKTIEPGKEISRAYRYLRKGNRRIAIIYLDHLQVKYPNWQEVYFAKAIGFYMSHRFEAMIDALKTSCRLGRKEACEDVEGFSSDQDPFLN